MIWNFRRGWLGSWILAAAFLFYFPSGAAQSRCESVFSMPTAAAVWERTQNRFEASTTLSQRIRDNASAYWATVRVWSAQSGWDSLPPSVSVRVLALGDGHSGNFTVLNATSPATGRNQPIYTFTDVKDFGRAPAIFDINRLIVNTTAILRENQLWTQEMEDGVIHEMFRSYERGLQNESFRLTAQFEGQIPSRKEFAKATDRRQEKAVAMGRFDLERNDLEPATVASRRLGISAGQLRRDVESAFRNLFGWGHLVDLKTRPRQRGGSKDSLRLWALFESNDRRLIFKEIKELVDPASAAFQDQARPEANLTMASQFLDYRIEDVSPIISIGGRDFLVRDKKVEFISVPYRQKSREDLDRLVEMSVAHARWIGTFHGRQMVANGSIDTYIVDLRSNRQRILELLRELNQTFLSGTQQSIR